MRTRTHAQTGERKARSSDSTRFHQGSDLENATILVHPREVFGLAIVAAASAIVIVSKHPSGEPEPSEADIRVTRDLIRAGQLFIIEVCDHIIMGNGRQTSLKTLGCFTR